MSTGFYEVFCFRLYVHARAESLLTRYPISRLWEFHQIYIFGAVGHRDELIRFQGRKLKVQGHRQRSLKIDIILGR